MEDLSTDKVFSPDIWPSITKKKKSVADNNFPNGMFETIRENSQQAHKLKI